MKKQKSDSRLFNEMCRRHKAALISRFDGPDGPGEEEDQEESGELVDDEAGASGMLS